LKLILLACFGGDAGYLKIFHGSHKDRTTAMFLNIFLFQEKKIEERK